MRAAVLLASPRMLSSVVPPPLRATGPPAGRLGHRRDVQVLRGVAVLAVMLYHADLLPGGFLGVDVFFAVSGFLIVTLLVEEVEATGAVDVRDFWARRVRRLLPASLLSLAAVLAWAAVFLPRLDLRPVGDAARAAALYVANLHFLGQDTSYLAPRDTPRPLLHYWSLGVEEQLYLVVPLLVGGAAVALAGRRGTRRAVLAGCCVVTVISGMAMLWAPDQPTAFFAPWTRAWQFTLGAAVGLAAPDVRGPRVTVAAGAAGAVLLCTFALLGGVRHPGPWLGLPMLATAILLATGRSWADQLSSRVRRPLTRLGDVSYSVYLWHWPMLVALEETGTTTLAARIAVLVVSVVIGLLSFRLVEEPLRRGSLLGGRVRPMALAVVGAAVLAVAGTVLPLIPRSSAVDIDVIAARASLPEVYADGCHASQRATVPMACELGPVDAPLVALIGDSHAAQWYPAFAELAGRGRLRLLHLSKSACPFVDLDLWNRNRERPDIACSQWQDAVLDVVMEREPVLTVLTNADRYVYIAGDDLMDTRTPRGGEGWARGVDDGLARMAAATSKLVYLRGTPRPTFDVPGCLDGADDTEACDLAEPAAVRVHELTDPALRGVPVIDPVAWLCDGRVCPAVVEGEVVYRDDSHLTAAFARSLADELWTGLSPLLEP